MRDAERVLVECAASPDDDAPRLVWADLVGGERGELVVIQCDLSRGGLAPSDIAARRRRERELLAAHGRTWAGSLATFARRWRYRRGFVETIEIEADKLQDSYDLADHPLVSAVSAVDWDVPMAHQLRVPRPPRAITFEGRIDDRLYAELSRLGWLAELRGLGAYALHRDNVSAFASLVTHELEQLWLRDHACEDLTIHRLLESVPNLVELEVTPSHGFRRMWEVRDAQLEPIVRLPLRTLAVGSVSPRGFRTLASMPHLEHLSCDLPVFGGDARRAMDDLQLRTLELGGEGTDEAMQALAARRIPTLRALHLRGATTIETLQRIADSYGDQLELLAVYNTLGFEPSAASALRSRFDGELSIDPARDGDWPRARLPVAAARGASSQTMFESHTTVLAASAHAWIVRLDKPQIWELEPASCTVTIDLGRSRDNPVVIGHSAIARRHARLAWRAGHHWVRDLSSTNGTWIGMQRILDGILVDGCSFRLADVPLRYFVGEGAEQRARAALAAALAAAGR